MSYESRVALVTGAGHGIGAGIADRLAGQGHRLVLVDRNADTLAESRERIVAAGGTALAIEADVADAAAMTAVVERVAGEVGPVEILVNNAGFARDHPISELGLDDWDAVNDVVLRAAFVLTRAVAPSMRERALGPDREYLQHLGPERRRACELRRREGRTERSDEGRRARARPVRHHGQRGRARGGRHRDDGDRSPAAQPDARRARRDPCRARASRPGRPPPRHRTRGDLLHRRGRGLHHRSDLVRVRLPATARPRPARVPPAGVRTGSGPGRSTRSSSRSSTATAIASSGAGWRTIRSRRASLPAISTRMWSTSPATAAPDLLPIPGTSSRRG